MLRRRKQCESYCHCGCNRRTSWCGKINHCAGSGKAAGVAIYVDTGALYRTIGLAAYRRGIAGTDTEKIIRMLSQITVGLQHQEGVQSVLLNGEEHLVRY